VTGNTGHDTGIVGHDAGPVPYGSVVVLRKKINPAGSLPGF
jgi:hypothetical protein